MSFDVSRHKQIAALVAECTGFDWDAGNIGKNWEAHRVSDRESEEIFVNRPIMFTDATKHATLEIRYTALGRTNGNRLVSVVFTIRKSEQIRVISSHDMSRKDRGTYGTQRT